MERASLFILDKEINIFSFFLFWVDLEVALFYVMPDHWWIDFLHQEMTIFIFR